MGKILSIKEKLPVDSTLPDGSYTGIWNGYVIEIRHNNKIYELKTDEGVEMLKEIFSEENIKKHNINLDEAYISCPKEKHSTHKCYYVVNTAKVENIKKFFDPVEVEIKEVAPFNYKNISKIN